MASSELKSTVLQTSKSDGIKGSGPGSLLQSLQEELGHGIRGSGPWGSSISGSAGSHGVSPG